MVRGAKSPRLSRWIPAGEVVGRYLRELEAHQYSSIAVICRSVPSSPGPQGTRGVLPSLITDEHSCAGALCGNPLLPREGVEFDAVILWMHKLPSLVKPTTATNCTGFAAGLYTHCISAIQTLPHPS